MPNRLPFLMGAAVTSAVPVLPGPTKSEWGAAAVGIVGLLVRELVYWLANRNKHG